MKVQVLDKGFVELLDVLGGDATIVATARLSRGGSGSEGGVLSPGDMQLIESLLRWGHGTPFEAVVFRFLVKCPLFVARQWMRHRIGWSFLEQSRRHITDDVEFYIPSYLSPGKKQMMQTSYEASAFAYKVLLAEQVSPGTARIVLPVSMYTTFLATVNQRAIMHWFGLRNRAAAQKEHREYALAVWKLVREHVPVTCRAYDIVMRKDGQDGYEQWQES